MVLRIGLLGLLIAAVGVGGWLYLNREAVERRRAVLRVADAPTLAQAVAEFRWFETPPDEEAKRTALVAHWGTGDERFDDYLVRYLGDSTCSEALRKRFSEELAWRPELRSTWAAAWRQRVKQQPEAEIASVLEFLDTLSAAENPPRLTWRQVLDVQAVFELRGRGELATWLSPENYRERYRAYVAAEP